MCMCATPNVNGQTGYRWNTANDSVHPVNPPDLRCGEELIYDLPGRCGRRSDSHSYHFRVVRMQGAYLIVVRHGGGDERMDFGHRWKTSFGELLESLDDDGRYWLVCSVYHIAKQEVQKAVDAERDMWRRAAAEKRIKTRKVKGGVRVTVLPPEKQAVA